MEDFKLYVNLEGLLSAVKKASDDIGIQFDLDKCVKVTFRKGSQVESENIFILTVITELEDIIFRN